MTFSVNIPGNRENFKIERTAILGHFYVITYRACAYLRAGITEGQRMIKKTVLIDSKGTVLARSNDYFRSFKVGEIGILNFDALDELEHVPRISKQYAHKYPLSISKIPQKDLDLHERSYDRYCFNIRMDEVEKALDKSLSVESWLTEELLKAYEHHLQFDKITIRVIQYGRISMVDLYAKLLSEYIKSKVERPCNLDELQTLKEWCDKVINSRNAGNIYITHPREFYKAIHFSLLGEVYRQELNSTQLDNLKHLDIEVKDERDY